MSVTKNEIMSYVIIAFLLLGALFGMQIMSFIFGNLGPEAAGLTEGTALFNISSQIQNDSLGAILTYSSGASTQFSTLNIAITLILLIGLFIIFWSLVMKGGVLSMGKDKGSGNFS